MLNIVKFMQTVDNKIVEILKSKGLTKRALSAYLGINETVINRTTRNPRITLQTLTKIAKFLECSVIDLLTGIDVPLSPLPVSNPDSELKQLLLQQTEIIREKDRQIAEKDAQIKRLFDLLEKK